MKNTVMINEKRNCSIDLFRLVCAVLVVAGHTKPFTEFRYAGYLATQILPRIAVPFFLCVSGYYYIKGLLGNKKNFKKNMIKLLKVYIFWSSIYILWDFAHVLSVHDSIIAFIKSTVLNFFIRGSYYHLWFFPTLFFCIIVATLFAQLHGLRILAWSSIVLYCIGLLGCSYYGLGDRIPLIHNLINSDYFNVLRRIIFMGLPFFMLGYFLCIIEQKYWSLLDGKVLKILGSIAVAGFIAEIVAVVKTGLQTNIIITVFLYLLVAVLIIFLLKTPMPQYKKQAYYARRLANFIYYAHPITIIGLNMVGNFNSVLLFVLTTGITMVIGYVVIKSDNKWINQIV